jgi:SAM-dependent methyltransferase
MKVQADVTAAQELSALYTDPAWHRAHAVVDLGTGNGAFLRHVAGAFPDKSYLGIDASSELIYAARRFSHTDRIRFNVLDLFELRGTFDYALLRLVVRHMDDLGRLVGQLGRLLGNGGGALVSDSDVDELFFWPSMPSVSSLFRRLDDAQRAKVGGAGGETVLDRFCALVDRSSGLAVGYRRKLIVPSTVGANLAAMREQYALAIELLERTGTVETAGAAAELVAWSERSDVFAQFGMELVRVEARSLEKE